jgi:hypothetical protein
MRPTTEMGQVRHASQANIEAEIVKPSVIEVNKMKRRFVSNNANRVQRVLMSELTRETNQRYNTVLTNGKFLG